ncbi:MAG: hypothetical protein AABX05_05410 [Nanoarchaeota archaeon]
MVATVSIFEPLNALQFGEIISAIVGILCLGIVYHLLLRTKGKLHRGYEYFFCSLAVYITIKLVRTFNDFISWPSSDVQKLILALANLVFLGFLMAGLITFSKMITECLASSRKKKK